MIDTVFEHALDGVIAIDESLVIVGWNPAAERMLGFTRAEVAFLDDGFVSFDFANRAVTVLGRLVQLTPTEYRLLRTFASSPDRVLSTETLLEEAWRDPSATAPTRVKHAIRRLRAKLARAGEPADTIEVVRGFGYRYRAPNGAAHAG